MNSIRKIHKIELKDPVVVSWMVKGGILFVLTFLVWLFFFRPFSYTGDGSLEEYGWRRMGSRSFSLTLGEISLNEPSESSYRITSLPRVHKPFTFGILLDATTPLDHFDTLVRMRFIEESTGHTIFDWRDDIRKWDRMEPGYNGFDYFVYRGERTSLGGHSNYPASLIVEVIPSGDLPLEHSAILFAFGGGWK